MLQIGERKKDELRRLPAERSHREVVILTLSDSKLFFKVCKAIELVTGVEFLVAFPVTALYLTVISERVSVYGLISLCLTPSCSKVISNSVGFGFLLLARWLVNLNPLSV